MKTKADGQRLRDYSEAFFQRSGRTEFPTVARCARSLGWTQKHVEDTVEDYGDSGLMMTQYNVLPEPRLGEKFVEVLQ